MGSKARIFIVLEYITGGELFETIVSADIWSIYLKLFKLYCLMLGYSFMYKIIFSFIMFSVIHSIPMEGWKKRKHANTSSNWSMPSTIATVGVCITGIWR
jgi:hypothetical protein